MKIVELLEQLIRGEHLSSKQMQGFTEACMKGELTDVQIGAVLSLLRMKGETLEELTTAAHTLKSFSHTIDLGPDLIDIVGTGGDGKNTFNISTVSSFVASAAGAKVAKHGNYSVSSRSGSADLLTQAGFQLTLSDAALQHSIQEFGITFLFAPRFHQAMKHAREARKQLKIRTLFNLLGPLLNPAQVKKQVVGVSSHCLLKPIAEILAHLGSTHALVVHSQDGLDEISISAVTNVLEYKEGEFKEWCIDPRQLNCYHENLNPLIVSSPKESLAIAQAVFSGEKGPARDIVLLNSAAALYCAGIVSDIQEGIESASKAIDNGGAYYQFHHFKEFTNYEQHS